MLLTIAILIAIEVTLKAGIGNQALASILSLRRRKAEDGATDENNIDVRTWQEYEQDAKMRARLEVMACNE